MNHTLCPKQLILLTAVLWCHITQSQETIIGTYANEIPTSFSTPPVHDPGCNGPGTTIAIVLPAGGNIQVTNVTVSYTMTTAFNGWMSEQRSKIYCQNSTIEESNWAEGIGDSGGTYPYNRDIDIANSIYPGGTILTFEMRAVRIWEGFAGCNVTVNKVDAGTWTVEVYYTSLYDPVSKVGVNSPNPVSTLDVNGKIKIGDDTEAPVAGNIRFNSITGDFEGYDGVKWNSFTQENENGGWGDNSVRESDQETDAFGSSFDWFGYSVSISDDHAIIGSTGNGSIDQGAAQIYARNGSGWTFQEEISAIGGQYEDRFGGSVSISGDDVVVGAYSDDVGSNLDQGSAHIFIRSGTNWVAQSSLFASDGDDNDYFGIAVAIEGDYAIVGASDNDVGSNTNQGAAYVFVRNGTSWTQQAQLLAYDGEADDYFGQSVAISGDYAIIGAPGKDNQDLGFASQGYAYVYKRNGAVWNLLAVLSASDGAAGDNFGQSVSISGDDVVIGAITDNVGSNVSQGSAYVYRRIGTTWSEQAMLIAPDGEPSDYFGGSVSISGEYVIVGARLHDIQYKESQGSAYIFKRNGTFWSLQTKCIASDGEADDQFGFSVSISGDYVVVGASYNQVGTNAFQGTAYFFNK